MPVLRKKLLQFLPRKKWQNLGGENAELLKNEINYNIFLTNIITVNSCSS